MRTPRNRGGGSFRKHPLGWWHKGQIGVIKPDTYRKASCRWDSPVGSRGAAQLVLVSGLWLWDPNLWGGGWLEDAGVSMGLDFVAAVGKKSCYWGEEAVLGGKRGTGSRWKGASLFFLLQPCILSLSSTHFWQILSCGLQSPRPSVTRPSIARWVWSQDTAFS